jgi:hypothetical protein
MLGPSVIALAIQMGLSERLVGLFCVTLPDARERRLPRVAFAGGWKAQDRDCDRALMCLGRTDGRIYCKLIEQTVVWRKMDNERVSPPLQ